jgi:superfamily I DNA/RNA helicase/Zn-dependent peptidase ImmA (M78 family)
MGKSHQKNENQNLKATILKFYMSHFDLIRQLAFDFRRQICGEMHFNLLAAEKILQLTENFTRIKRLGVTKDDPILSTASAVLDENRIYFDKTLPPSFALFCQAHEYAHFRLHEISAHCTSEEINFTVAETESFDAESRVLGYGQSERTEREANIFAAEFILPCSVVRKAFTEDKLTASQIAQKVGISVNLVYSQLAQSLISTENRKQKTENEINPKSEIRNPKDEDRTQIGASRTEICPTLLEAAPGTGKTQTLIERICYLLREREVVPESILALTFSNKAAEEMRERIAVAVDKETAARIYMTTFHAFGLNLLRKFHNAANLSANAPVIDRIMVVVLLEEKLLSLELKHFQNLREPLENLPAILATISRAKDELVSAEDFQKLAHAQRQKAETADEVEKAEKCLETARVYRIYDEILRERNLLDYGDLIFRAVELLRENTAIREQITEEFQHILVDEYQDVNRVSAELLRLISNSGNGVWAVGDARQAIYRWRGAATTRNIRDFSKDFPDPQNLFLGKNYRSRPRIVAAVSTFAKELDESETSESFTDWAAHRAEETGEIRFAVTENLTEEVDWIAEQMRDLHEKGIIWREQAVIARTHKILQKIAEKLEQRGIPILYIGNWLESEIVRDLCTWLALNAGDKYALVRVANFNAYKISFADVQRIISDAIENQVSITETINSLAASPVCDEKTKKSFGRLLEDFSRMPMDSSVWKILTNYLFDNGSYLADFENNLNASARLALYQLLQLAQSFDAKNAAKNLSHDAAIQEFLRYVRRLKSFGEEQALQQLPVSMQETDAVRLLTIHASKGLEFEAVFVPYLGGRYYPKSGKGNNCPLPDGITDLDEKAERNKEEKSLFFVAISRAKQILCLSRSIIYGKQPSNASPFLKALAEHLPSSPESGATWYSEDFKPESGEITEVFSTDNFQKPEFFLRELEDYNKCPRRYFYQTRLKKEKTVDAIYLEFYRALHKALNFCFEETAANRLCSPEKLQKVFQENWTFSSHAYSELYMKEAFEILNNAHRRISAASIGDFKRKIFYFDLPNGRILFTPDFFLESETDLGEKQISAQYWRNSKLRKKESDEMLYQLLHESAKQNSIEAEIKVVSLKSGEEIFVPRKLKRGKEIPPQEKFSALIEAINGILRQDFSPKPTDNCPTCRFYFICSPASIH